MEPQRSTADSAQPTLGDVLAAHGFDLPAEQIAQLDRYRELLWSWNEKLNLTRHTTLEKFVTRDVVDATELARLMARRERVLDVGTGGGVPGVILAILRPDLRVAARYRTPDTGAESVILQIAPKGKLDLGEEERE